LGTLQTQLTSVFQLTVVESGEAADTLPMEATPVIAIKGELSVTTLVEDELLLAVPIVALHEEENCPGIGWQTSYEKPHPMAVLAELKEQQDK
ncbi:MAG: 23S rRNA accumulation protein YceD, partial [Gammaproteobacteria bacterium]|nr:23S rRNA accumulation protein YceD [Gammaproteobacteria bacterium]